MKRELKVNVCVNSMFLFWRTSVGDNLVYTDWKKDNYIEAIKQTLGKEAKGIKIYVTKKRSL